MNPPNLRDADGVVHHSYGEPLYDSDELKITRARHLHDVPAREGEAQCPW